MSKVRVVVTGMGVVAPNGHGLVTYATALREGRSGIRHIEKLKELSFACQVGGIPEGTDELAAKYFTEDERMALNAGMIYGAIAARDAFQDAGLRLIPRNEDFVYEDTGAVIATGVGGLDTFSEKVYPGVMAGKVKRLGSTIVEQVMSSSVSATVGGMLALGGQVTTNSCACSSGNEAVIMGLERIRAGRSKRMVVGGAEGSCPMSWAGFDSMRVLARNFNDRPQQASRPMSATADGFVPGSGAGVLVLEELETARERGARIYAEVLGGALVCGGMRFGGTMTAPSPRGVQRCVREAILDSGIDPRAIEYINGHLTATMADPMEIKNWSEALERGPDSFPLINSTKSMIGHGLGAAGAMECVATILQLTRGFIHGSINCEDLHPGVEAYSRSIVRKTIERKCEIGAKASFGFGDVNSCVIFKTWRS